MKLDTVDLVFLVIVVVVIVIFVIVLLLRCSNTVSKLERNRLIRKNAKDEFLKLDRNHAKRVCSRYKETPLSFLKHVDPDFDIDVAYNARAGVKDACEELGYLDHYASTNH